MKKYFNKGLMYQWFNSAKMMILLGIVAWGFYSNIMVENYLDDASRRITNSFFNIYDTYNLFYYGILGVIFAVIHFMSQGINKRNNNMFLTDAPYTKKQIKYNEFICLMITLAVFILVMIYINVMAYVRHYELVSIIDGYFLALGIEVLRMILFGTMGIFILLIIDSMFSNTIMGMICMVSILPGSLFFIFYKLMSILDYISLGNGENIWNKIRGFRTYDPLADNRVYLVDGISMRNIDIGHLFKEISVVIVILAILAVIYNITQKKFKVESNTKMFTSRLNERIVVIMTSAGAGSFASFIFVSNYIDELRHMKYMYAALSGANLAKALSADFFVMGLVGIVVYKLLNKFVKTIQ